MSAQHRHREYLPVDRETSLKFAVQRLDESGVRAQLIEGEFEIMAPTWDHENAVHLIRDGLAHRARELKCVKGSGNLDLPGTENWYLPDIAIIPQEIAKGAKSLPVDEALLVVEVTSESNASDDRIKKRRRYGQFGVPLYLLVDRIDGTWTLFSDPVHDGYAQAEGPHAFGVPVRLPEPFGIEIDTTGL
ncbi:putative restriction endonuclease [Streptomyces sp. 3211.6]|uniref:Uma2 family endonuclease n=1 Tax=Streptomyces sp. 3211.6 TaxID=1938845 RepID=UPI000EB12125|nr:Uma2 family endonuclease [Streptomyces sp. 3211.6]RKT04438.1 putative restriction endonuclease [Streptomyces sp. 3211.6]